MDRLRLRLEIDELNAAYAACLDDGDLDDWPGLFTAHCRYEIVPRENYDRGLPLALMRCESRAMLVDRVVALRRSSVYSPRSMRHLISGVRIVGIDEVDLDRHYISWRSPLGRALMKAGPGDRVVLRAPGGTEELEILEVRYERIPIDPFTRATTRA